MRRIIAIILAISALACADVQIECTQNAANISLTLRPIGNGAYVEIYLSDSLPTPRIAVERETTLTYILGTHIPADACSLRIRSSNFDCAPDVHAIDATKTHIGSGWFKIGADGADTVLLRNLGATNEFLVSTTPSRWVFLPSFDITNFEATCSLYSRFVLGGGYADSIYWSVEGWAEKIAGGWSGPATVCTDGANAVCGISFWEAQACAHWMGGDLPTEAQWEASAVLCSGTIFPWGNEFCLPEYALTANISDLQQCAPTDPFGGGAGDPMFFSGDMSAAGCLSMGGNVSEWCRDMFSTNYYSTLDPLAPTNTNGTRRSVRGGNFVTDDRFEATAFSRAGYSSSSRHNTLGFRVAFDIGDETPTWASSTFKFDCQLPESVSTIRHGCLKQTAADSFAITFSEPVWSSVSLLPSIPGLSFRWTYMRDTLWVLKEPFVFVAADTITLRLSAIRDSVGNYAIPESITVAMPVCTYELTVDTTIFCAPVGCMQTRRVPVENTGLREIYVDSVTVGFPFALVGHFAEILAPAEIDTIIVSFSPDCAGSLSTAMVFHHSDGTITEQLSGYACPPPVARLVPASFLVENSCTTFCDTLFIVQNACAICESLEVCSAEFLNNTNFSIDSIEGRMLTTATDIAFQLCFTPTGRGTFSDSLYLRFRPIGGVCCDATTISAIVIGVCSECNPSPNYDAVSGSDIIEFTDVCDVIRIYDTRGRLVRKIEASSSGHALWDLNDADGRKVDGGIYYWKSGSVTGNIIVAR